MLMSTVKRMIHRLGPAGQTERPRFADISADDLAIIEQVRPYTMTSTERLYSLLQSVRYVVDRNIPGAFAECGVWLGGSVLLMIKQLQAMGITDRDIYLYDTFEGMPEPTSADLSDYDSPALQSWNQAKASGVRAWNKYFAEERFSEAKVRETVLGSGYPEHRIHFVRGRVEDTIPEAAPKQLALLRLDTDWYESTHHEMTHLYPRLSNGGALIVDDYGHWQGCRKAVDEYFSSIAPAPLLHRVDYTCRIAIKT